MALATLSNEQNIRDRLAKLNCAENQFVKFNNVVGRTRFVEAMTGRPTTEFNAAELERLTEVISDMEELQEAVNKLRDTIRGSLQDNILNVGIDWGRTDDIETALTVRRVARIANEVGDTCVDACAAAVIKQIADKAGE
jgi:hypothetical protein